VGTSVPVSGPPAVDAGSQSDTLEAEPEVTPDERGVAAVQQLAEQATATPVQQPVQQAPATPKALLYHKRNSKKSKPSAMPLHRHRSKQCLRTIGASSPRYESITTPS
jgi:hypothetical protein